MCPVDHLLEIFNSRKTSEVDLLAWLVGTAKIIVAIATMLGTESNLAHSENIPISTSSEDVINLCWMGLIVSSFRYC